MPTRLSKPRGLAARRAAPLFAAAAAFVAAALSAHGALANEKINFLTSWKAEAEHGGFYQAQATGIYKKYGLDVTIRQGGPQINATQMLVAGAVDMAMLSSNDDLLVALKNGGHITAVMAGMQKSPRVLLAHPDSGIKSLADMKGRPILISSESINTMFAWLKAKYGFKDSQIRKYTFNMAPFIAEKSAIQQGYVSSEPYVIKKEGGFDPEVFLLADYGYDTYATIVAVPNSWIKTKPKVVQDFVNASIDGWYSYMYGDPWPANALIKKDNPEMTDDTIAYSIETMKKYGIVDSGDSLKEGIGAMSDARWKSQFDAAASVGVYPKDLPYKEAYTLQFVNKGHGLEMKSAMKPKM